MTATNNFLSYQMPSATVGNNAVQSSSPELGSGTQSEAMKQVLQVIDKKVRNMEKKKVTMFPVFHLSMLSDTSQKA